MKKFVLIFALLFSVVVNGQVKVQGEKLLQTEDLTSLSNRHVDVRVLYPDLDKKAIEYVQNHPEYNTNTRLNKSSWNFTLESQYEWYALNFPTSNFYKVPSTCKKVGTNCYVFVENSSWGTRITQAAVDSVQKAFDERTPANSSVGIYKKDTDVFGTPPDVDGDPKIIILILDIKDSYTKAGDAYTVGYFHGYNELPKSTNSGSNEAEIYYLDCNPLNLTTTEGIKDGMSTAAHEFQHMIHWNYHHSPSQTTFLNEGCSLVAEYINGYDFREQSRFANDTPQQLFQWRTGNDALKDYSRAARFMLYYYEQFGTEFLTKFVQSSLTDIQGINDALGRLSTRTLRTFADILPDWYLANAVDNRTVNSKWGYLLTGMPKPQGSLYWSANVNTYSAAVPFNGVQIITHKASLSLNSTFSGMNSTYHKIKAIKLGTGNPVIEDVNLNSTYNVPVLNPAYSSVQYLVFNSSTTTNYGFQYSSTGSNPAGIEISYDVNPSVGYLTWAASDTVAVYFDAISQGKLDSIKVQFSGTGNVTGGIWEYTGVLSPTPLGKKLLSNMTANPASAAWLKVDLRNYNLSTGKAFAVAYPVVTGAPKVRVSEYTSTSSYHSYSYLSSAEATPDPAGWYPIAKDASTLYIYQIRAYVSVGTVGNEKTIELLPSNYSLSQNYPNPFNPSTKIQFSLPEQSRVTIRIYDMLGREVKTLINADQSAGTHEIVWNGDDEAGRKVATGVYMYAISTNKFVQTKKMVLLK